MISRNGVPVVGFGDAEMTIASPIVYEPRHEVTASAIGYVVGAVAGAVLGNYVKQGLGTAIGSIVGGAVGTFSGAALWVHNQRKAAQEVAAQQKAAAPAPKQ